MSTLEIKPAQRQEDLVAVVDLLDRAFDKTPREYFDRHVLHDPTLAPGDTLMGFFEGRLVSSVQIFPRTAWIKGERVKFGGIGNVATLPQDRKQGYAGLLLETAIHTMKQAGYAFAMLTTTFNHYYEKFGFLTIPRKVALLGDLPPKTAPAVRPFDRWRDLAVVKRLYEDYNRDSVGPLARDDLYWYGQFDFCGEDPSLFLVREAKGVVTGYIRGAIEKGSLQVLEFAAVSVVAETFDALLCSLAARSPGTPLRLYLSNREQDRLQLQRQQTIEVDSDLMVLVLDERFRTLVEQEVMFPGALMFWLSDFF